MILVPLESTFAAGRAQAEILLLENPHLTFSLDEVVDNLERADGTNTAVSNPADHRRQGNRAGAHSARIVTETY